MDDNNMKAFPSFRAPLVKSVRQVAKNPNDEKVNEVFKVGAKIKDKWQVVSNLYHDEILRKQPTMNFL